MVALARVSDLAFTYLRPTDFRPLEVPDQAPDFGDPSHFMQLHVATATSGDVQFSVAARPAYHDGTVEEWTEYLAKTSRGRLLCRSCMTIGGRVAILLDTREMSDVGTVRVRTAVFEDGGRLLKLSVLAPETVWDSVEPMLETVLTSFRLTEPRGATVPLTRQTAGGIG